MNTKDLIYVIRNFKTDEEAEDFLVGILTPQELADIITRLKIVRKLKQGISQHLIAEQLGVGVGTVTRGSREIKNNRFKFI